MGNTKNHENIEDWFSNCVNSINVYYKRKLTVCLELQRGQVKSYKINNKNNEDKIIESCRKIQRR